MRITFNSGFAETGAIRVNPISLNALDA